MTFTDDDLKHGFLKGFVIGNIIALPIFFIWMVIR